MSNKALIIYILLFFWGASAFAENSYMEMSLEDLMDLSVTSMSKREQPFHDTAAAIYVLTSDDIRRSGASTIPEALRLVPGLMVGQNCSHIWSVSSRGRTFNPIFEGKLLVMIDGRSIYSPVFSGVFWEAIDIVMEDIERIEVIRGPGNSAWGTNAVNGIINIITKSSADTQGAMLSGNIGNKDFGIATARYGGSFSEGNTYRIYAKYRDLTDFNAMDGIDLNMDLEGYSTGFRTDLTPDNDSSLTLQGDAIIGNTQGFISTTDIPTASMVQQDVNSNLDNFNLLSHYRRELGDYGSLNFQSSLGRYNCSSPVYKFRSDTLDFDFQYEFSPLPDHKAQWGLGYSLTRMHSSTETPALDFAEDDQDMPLFSAFVQDEISFADNAVVLTLGTKFEHNRFSGLEILPSARVLWHVTNEHALWGAVSRSVRTPSIVDLDVDTPIKIETVMTGFGPMPLQASLVGNQDLDSESFLVWELGHRFTPSSKFFLDTTVFYTQSDDMISYGYDRNTIYPSVSPLPHLQLDLDLQNSEAYSAYGLELNAVYIPLPWWKLQGWYTFFRDDFNFEAQGEDAFADINGQMSPRHQISLRSSIDLPHDVELDIMGRYISELPAVDVPDYATIDARLGWLINKNTEIALVGKNLLQTRHIESGAGILYGQATAIERSALLQVRLTF